MKQFSLFNSNKQHENKLVQNLYSSLLSINKSHHTKPGIWNLKFEIKKMGYLKQITH